METLVEQLQQLQTVNYVQLTFKVGETGKLSNTNKLNAGTGHDHQSIHGHFFANFNVDSALGQRGIHGVRFVACLRVRNRNNADETAVSGLRKVVDITVRELPPIRMSFHVWQPKNKLRHPKSLVRLEITGTRAAWLPIEQQKLFKQQLNRFLAREGAGNTELESTNLNARFQALLNYIEHRALFDLFAIRKQDCDDDKPRLTLLLLLEQQWNETCVAELVKAPVLAKSLWEDRHDDDIDESEFVIESSEQNVLLCGWSQMTNIWNQFLGLERKGKVRKLPQKQLAPRGSDEEEHAAENDADVQELMEGLRLDPAVGHNHTKLTQAAPAVRRAVIGITKASASNSTNAAATKIRATERRRQRRARQSRIACAICAGDKLPSAFYRLTKCQHRFCRECLKKAITIAIQDKSAKLLKCLDFECQQPIDYIDVKKLIPQQMFEKFDELLLELEMATMDDVETCPNEACKMQYVIDSANLALEQHTTAQCPHCNQVLCLMCKEMLWIVPGEPPHVCVLNGACLQYVLDAYESATTTPTTRLALEQLYGRQKLQNLCDNRRSEREVESKKKCPQCKAPCVKDEGCNKVMCAKCGTVWCWLCNAKIPANGYAHFAVGANGEQTGCAERLWEGVPVRDVEVVPPAAAAAPEVLGNAWRRAEEYLRQLQEEREFPRLIAYES